jgi:hypothetical protein
LRRLIFLFFFVTRQIFVLALMLLCNVHTPIIYYFMLQTWEVFFDAFFWLTYALYFVYFISRCRCLCFLWILQSPRAGSLLLRIYYTRKYLTNVYNPAEEKCNLYNYKNEWGDRGVDYNYIITPIMITHYYYSHDTV